MSVVNPYRIVIADRQAPFREGLKKLLLQRADIDLAGEASDGSDLLNLLDRLTLTRSVPHLVLLDISGPDHLGIEATRKIKIHYPEMQVLIMGMWGEREYVRYALSAGAQGYLTKAEMEANLFAAIETIRQGGVYTTPLLPEG